jgi:hypothetical protein
MWCCPRTQEAEQTDCKLEGNLGHIVKPCPKNGRGEGKEGERGGWRKEEREGGKETGREEGKKEGRPIIISLMNLGVHNNFVNAISHF